MQIAICDDEAYMTDLLTTTVSKYFARQNINTSVSCFSSGTALLASDINFRIIFLDVQMKHLDGFETAQILRQRGFNHFLIFITIMREDVFRAFEVNAFDYLVKPLLESDFNRTMDRLLRSIRQQPNDQLFIKSKKGRSIIPFENIIYCEIINRKIYLHLKDSSVIDYYDKIGNLEKKLDNRFFQCHRSYLINLQYLRSYQGGAAFLTNGETIPVSRLRSNELSSAVLQYMKQRRHGK